MRKTTFLILLVSFVFYSLSAQNPVTYEQAFSNLSFEFPVEIQNANDGSNRLFVVEQSGRIKVFQNTPSVSSQQTFLDIRNIVSFSSGQEIGLLGLAFHPNYGQNGYFYVYHTRQSTVPNVGVEIVLARYQVSASNPNQANTSSRLEIFSFDKNQGNSNHNGGKIGFGPDGYLYISVGDGGGSGDPRRNAQNLDNIFGSILRIDVDVNGNNPLESNPDAPNGNYEIPSDNPRRGQSGLDELYAWGIRNTWKFSWDGNRMWGADVGQANLEEINIIERGGNYGWNRFEGNSNYNTSVGLATSPDRKPVFTYGHGAGDVSITGGYVYKGSSTNSDLQGKYIYGDYVSGRVWALSYNSSNNTATSKLLFRTNGEFISSFGLDESGELYFSGYGTSAKIFKINGGTTPPPPPGPTTVAVDGIGVWKELERGTNGTVEAVAVQGDNVYVAGSFSTAGDLSANNIAVYNKNEGWKSLSSGANGIVKALAIAGDGRVYAGGSFTSIGGVSAQNVAVWNGSSWAALGSGTNGTVAKIGIDGNNNVYVGGEFAQAGGISVRNIARWNNGWSALTDASTSVSGTNNEIRAIAFDSNNTLYVGGNFDNAGGKTANRIATWNGNTWGTLGQGTSGFVQAIAVTAGFVYAGGNFSLANGTTVNRVARWNRSSNQWQTLGNGLSGNVNSLLHDGTYLYAGGSFETAGRDASTNHIVKNVARWSSSNGWQAMGPSKSVGTNNIVNAIALSDDNSRLYTGGAFSIAGNIGASRMAVWAQSFDCTDERLITEYQINGEWSSGATELTLDEGTRLVLSLLPNNLEFTITLPSGDVVSNDYNLGELTSADSGTYTFRTSGGCETSLSLTVNGTSDPCTSDSVIPEYRIENGSWVRGDSQITVDEGTRLALSIFPDDKQFTIELPNGNEVSNDLDLGAVTPSQAGAYLFTSEDGCTATFTISVIEDEEVCPEGSIVPEYTVNGVVGNGQETITVNTGDQVNLSAVGSAAGLRIRLPSGLEVGDKYEIASIDIQQSGTYTFISNEGCEATLGINVNDSGSGEDPSCDNVQAAYRINDENWVIGTNTVILDEGDALTLTLVPNGTVFTVTLPNGSVFNNAWSVANFTPEMTGSYLLTTDEGCTETLFVRLDSEENPVCDIIPEYRLNRVWYSGETNLTVDEGTEVVLSALPNDVAIRITLPDGRVVSDNYNLGLVTAANTGTYEFTTDDGCTVQLNLTVEDSGCDGILIPEYRINGKWLSGNNIVTVNQGADVVISMLPNGVGLNVTLPDGTVVGDNYKLPDFTTAQSGTYVLTSEEGCTETLELRVADSCAENIIPEYRIDGTWSSGQNDVSVVAGTNVVLSMLPNNVALTITKPDGTTVGDNFVIPTASPADSGVYTIRSEEGCTNVINLTVTEESGCPEGSVIAEYRLDGVWNSGKSLLSVEEGTNVILSGLPNNLNLSITLPNGDEVGDNYSLGAVTPSNNGFYVITSAQGCKTVLQLEVIENGAGRNNSFVDFNKDFESSERATDLITAYPNPTTDVVNIDLYSLQGRPVDITVTNMQQQQVVFKSLNENHGMDLQLDLGNFNTGTYFVNILSEGEIITKKVVKR